MSVDHFGKDRNISTDGLPLNVVQTFMVNTSYFDDPLTFPESHSFVICCVMLAPSTYIIMDDTSLPFFPSYCTKMKAKFQGYKCCHIALV